VDTAEDAELGDVLEVAGAGEVAAVAKRVRHFMHNKLCRHQSVSRTKELQHPKQDPTKKHNF
jgi:hypothetical protein